MSKDQPDTAADPLAPNEQPYRDERGGTAGVGAFRRDGGHDRPTAVSDDPEREVRGEPAFGWDPQHDGDKTPRSDAEYREMLEQGRQQEPQGTQPPVRDNDLGPNSAPQSLLHPQPWGVQHGNYAPTQGPLGPDDFDEQKDWPKKDSYDKSS